MGDPIQQYNSRTLRQQTVGSSNCDEETDIHLSELLDDLDNDGINDDVFLKQYREKRMQEISDHVKLVDRNVTEQGYGKVQILEEESQLLQLSSKTSKLIVHFMLDQFDKCQYMNEKLEILARKYLTTKFVMIKAENCPFLVEKLKIKVLPFVIGYIDGKERLRSIGFAKLGNNPSGFPIQQLEQLFHNAGLLTLNIEDNEIGRSSTSHQDNPGNSDSDSSLDI